MIQIIGQYKLLTTINNYNLQTLPKTLLFLGPRGCGKHLITKYIAEKFEFDFIEVNEKVSVETLSNFSAKTINTLYLIDLDAFDAKQQNVFLKIAEQPPKTAYIIFIASSETDILNTIKNRCIKYYFEPYTKEELQAITHETALTADLAYDIFKTPGKLSLLTNDTFKQLYELAEKVVDKLTSATYVNAAVILTKLNFKDNYDKLDPEMFLETIEYIAFNRFKQGDNSGFKIFSITNQYKQYFKKKALIKETLILNYLTALWENIHIK